VTNAEPAAALEPVKQDLVGLDRTELATALEPMGVSGFRVKQIWQWIYNRGATDFEQMTNLSKQVRLDLADRFVLGRPGISTHQLSTDGTQKWLLRFPDGKEVESVHIPEADRGTLCVSSQVGCTLNCKFCHTGTQLMVRNLTAAEIVGQVMLVRDAFDQWPAPDHDRALTNVVLMGMGEPLYNYDNVAKAMRIVMDGEGLGISKRRITLSTAGVVPMIGRVGEELGVNLAISLHAVRDELRDMLVPINKKYPLEQLMQACRDYPGLSNARRITFEYVMLKGVNDSLEDAQAMAELLRDIPAKINLIPFNPWPGSVFECSSNNAIRRFADFLSEAGYSAPVRHPRGQDILAACGQLKSASEKMRASERRKLEAATADAV
jgi:23S rRNA (adenine2503-C2)-methyltransferase